MGDVDATDRDAPKPVCRTRVRLSRPKVHIAAPRGTLRGRYRRRGFAVVSNSLRSTITGGGGGGGGPPPPPRRDWKIFNPPPPPPPGSLAPPGGGCRVCPDAPGGAGGGGGGLMTSTTALRWHCNICNQSAATRRVIRSSMVGGCIVRSASLYGKCLTDKCLKIIYIHIYTGCRRLPVSAEYLKN